MTKIILIRHGESEANSLGVIAGWRDYRLTALGLAQAEETAAHLADEKIDLICSSDLIRAYETAEANAKRRCMTVYAYPELRETYCGDWEGITLPNWRLMIRLHMRNLNARS